MLETTQMQKTTENGSFGRYQDDPHGYWYQASEQGIWTDSGLGDGSYFCYRGLNAKGEPVSLSIVFLYAEGV